MSDLSQARTNVISSLLSTSRLVEEMGEIRERLSSGLRINSLSDDPGSALRADKSESDAAIFDRGITNSAFVLEGVDQADMAASFLSSILETISSYAELAANSVTSHDQRAILDEEAKALTSEFNAIVQNTRYNGRYLTNGSTGSIVVQQGFTQTSLDAINLSQSFAATIVVDTGEQAIVPTGTFAASTTSTIAGSTVEDMIVVDVNNDGNLDIVSVMLTGELNIALGNGNGSFNAAISYSSDAGQLRAVTSSDFNSDGYQDLAVTSDGVAGVHLNNGNGTFLQAVTWANLIPPVGGANGAVDIAAASLNPSIDSTIDVVVVDLLAEFTDPLVQISYGNGDGTFQAPISFGSSATNRQPSAVEVVDLDGAGGADIITAASSSNWISVYLSNGDGSFNGEVTYATASGADAMTLADLNGDNKQDVVTVSGTTVNVLLGNGNGTFKSVQSTTIVGAAFNDVVSADLNNDGYDDIVASSDSTVRVFISNGDGTFTLPTTYSLTNPVHAVAAGDLNGDGAVDIAADTRAVSTTGIFLANTTLSGVTSETVNLTDVDLTSSIKARATYEAVQSIIALVEVDVAQIAGSQLRLESSISMLAAQRDSHLLAADLLRSADRADESARAVRTEILLDRSTALFAQANLEYRRVFALLGGDLTGTDAYPPGSNSLSTRTESLGRPVIQKRG